MLIERSCEFIAQLVNGQLIGKSAQMLSGISSLQNATATDVAFWRDKGAGSEMYKKQILPSKAGVVLVPMSFDLPVPEGRAWIKCVNPSLSFAKVTAVFKEPMSYAPGIAKSACIDKSAEIGKDVHIGENVVIGKRVKIGANTAILPDVVLGDDVCIGEKCILYPHVVIREQCIVGNHVIIHPGVVIGGDGFGYEDSPEGYQKIPQVGIVQIDDDVEIGSNTTIDRARFGRTWIQKCTKIDNLVQIGHNVVIGENCFIVSQVGIAGSTTVGNKVVIYGQAGIAGHLIIGDNTTIMAQSGVTKNVPAGSKLFGSPAKSKNDYCKDQMYIKKLPSLVKELEELMTRLFSALKY